MLLYINITTYLLFLLIAVIFLIVYFFVNYKKTKLAETAKLVTLHKEIEQEKDISISLKNVSTSISTIEKGTKIQFKKILTEIVNLDFSLNDIF